MTKHHYLRSLGLALGTLLTWCLPTAASVVVFTCTGTIEPSVYIDHGAFDASVGPDTPFSAAFAFGIAPAGQANSDSNSWSYIDRNPLHEAYIQFGNYLLAPDPMSYALNTSAGTNDSAMLDSLLWESYNSAGSGLSDTFVQARLQDNSGRALTASGLPLTGPGTNDITKWDSGLLVFAANSAATGQRVGWYGHLNSISTRVQETPVPEPGTLALLAAGAPLAALALRRRRADGPPR